MMNKSAVRLALAYSVCVVGAATISGSIAGELTNGTFEAAGVWVPGSGSVTFDGADDHARNGSRSATVDCEGAGCVTISLDGVLGGVGSFSQEILGVASGIYQLNYFIRTDAGSVACDVAASIGPVITAKDPTCPSPEETYSGRADYSAVSGGDLTITFALRRDVAVDDSLAIHMDDVSFLMVDDGNGNNIAAASQTNAFQNTYGFLDRLQNRFGHAGSPVSVALNTTITVADNSGGYISPNGKYRAYMGGYGDRSKWDGGDVHSRRWGLTAGAEMAVSDGLDLGVAVAAGHSRFSTDTLFTDNRGKADEYAAALYGHFGGSSIPVYVTAAAGYGYSSNDLSRTSSMALGTAVARNVEATQWFGSVELGYDWTLSKAFILTPYARADGARIDQDGYTETVLLNDPIKPMTVAPVDQDAARTILGVRGTIDLNVGRRGAKLNANAGWAHEFERDRAVSFLSTSRSIVGGGSATFAGVATGATPDANGVVAGASVEAPVSDEARIHVGYNGLFASGNDSHGAEAGLRIVW